MILPYRERLKQSADSAAYAKAINALPDTLVGMTGVIAGLYLAPIKSAGMLDLDAAVLGRAGLMTPHGVFHDRSAMIAFEAPGNTEQGEYQLVRLSQREIPELALVRAHLNADGDTVMYTAPGMPTLQLHAKTLRPRKRESGSARVRMFPTDAELCDAVPVPNEAVTAWFQSFLKGKSDRYPAAKVVVVMRPEQFTRKVPAPHLPEGEEAHTGYSDGDQILVASRGTLAWLNQGLVAEHGSGFRGIEMAAFRPEMVLGDIPACAEDLIEEFEIDFGNGGSARVVLTCHCVRCSVTQVNQFTGTRDDNEPVKWLIANRPHRQDAAKKPTFGYNAYVPGNSLGVTVRNGMSFTVTKERT